VLLGTAEELFNVRAEVVFRGYTMAPANAYYVKACGYKR